MLLLWVPTGKCDSAWAYWIQRTKQIHTYIYMKGVAVLCHMLHMYMLHERMSTAYASYMLKSHTHAPFVFSRRSHGLLPQLHATWLPLLNTEQHHQRWSWVLLMAAAMPAWLPHATESQWALRQQNHTRVPAASQLATYITYISLVTELFSWRTKRAYMLLFSFLPSIITWSELLLLNTCCSPRHMPHIITCHYLSREPSWKHIWSLLGEESIEPVVFSFSPNILFLSCLPSS